MYSTLAEKPDLPTPLEIYRQHLVEYSNHRLQQTLLLLKAAEEKTTNYRSSIDSVQKKINVLRKVIHKEKGAVRF